MSQIDEAVLHDRFFSCLIVSENAMVSFTSSVERSRTLGLAHFVPLSTSVSTSPPRSSSISMSEVLGLNAGSESWMGGLAALAYH